MKNLFLLTFAGLSLVLSGCATSESTAEKNARWEQLSAETARDNKIQQEREAAQKEAKATTVPGMSADQVKAIWGRCDQIEYAKDAMIFNYNNDDHPVKMKFKNGRLIELTYDREAEERIRQQKRERELDAERAKTDAELIKLKRIEAINAGSSSSGSDDSPILNTKMRNKQKLRCNTTSYGNQSTTECNQ